MGNTRVDVNRGSGGRNETTTSWRHDLETFSVLQTEGFLAKDRSDAELCRFHFCQPKQTVENSRLAGHLKRHDAHVTSL